MNNRSRYELWYVFDNEEWVGHEAGLAIWKNGVLLYGAEGERVRLIATFAEDVPQELLSYVLSHATAMMDFYPDLREGYKI